MSLARSSSSNLATSFWSIKAVRNSPRKTAPSGSARSQAGAGLVAPIVTPNPSANAVSEMISNIFGKRFITGHKLARALALQLAIFCPKPARFCATLEGCVWGRARSNQPISHTEAFHFFEKADNPVPLRSALVQEKTSQKAIELFGAKAVDRFRRVLILHECLKPASGCRVRARGRQTTDPAGRTSVSCKCGRGINSSELMETRTK
ncbi:hypothetical protein SBV1_1710023 [Verrucomicrobia bacterium]|nr:hypothetical protein SBV1_1710023 [Verrucomicrobiota bacterium]